MIIFFFLVFINSLYAQDLRSWGQYWFEMTDKEKYLYFKGLRECQVITVNEIESSYRSSESTILDIGPERFKEMIKMFKEFQGKLYLQINGSELVDIIKITDNLYRDKRNNNILFPYMIRFAINRYKGHDIDQNLKIYRYKILNPDATWEELQKKFQLQ